MSLRCIDQPSLTQPPRRAQGRPKVHRLAKARHDLLGESKVTLFQPDLLGDFEAHKSTKLDLTSLGSLIYA